MPQCGGGIHSTECGLLMICNVEIRPCCCVWWNGSCCGMFNCYDSI